ncbi:FAD-dependent oxidoreductase [Ilumatobacter sp.]|uniref:FAD-dependent oxidoreductase n=1 Tax=Ilumatobacter sp. TaxID=1967498 RepID=UPI003B51BE18
MTEHPHRTIERRCDVVVVGGSAAGLAAALQLLRQRRSVIVVDAGEPRNAPAAHLHGFLTRDGSAPSELTAIGRSEVRGYGGEVLDGRVLDVAAVDDGRFRADLVGGHSIVARRVVVATGLVDELPDVDGLGEHWGRGVIHCPFCHGFEVRDRRIVQLLTHPLGLHQAALFRQSTSELTVVVHGEVDVEGAELDALEAGGVRIVRSQARRVVTGEDGQIAAVELLDGERIDAEAVVVGPRFTPRLEPFATLGLRAVAHPNGHGEHVEADVGGATSVAGVHVAGNVTGPSQQVLHAAADGSWTGATVAAGLAAEDLADASRPTAHAADWDLRYAGEQVWSGNPNGSLVREVEHMAPGRALDVGAGEGGDAIWLAERGWSVTANDISRGALDRIAAEARRRERDVELLHADANDRAPFERSGFDLVSACYASIPRTPDGRGVANLIGAVAPGGTLLVVSHDLAPMRAPIDTAVSSRAFDPDAHVRVDDVVAALRATPGWTIDVAEARPRPAGAASAGHHVDDVVLRAHRSSG